jgi:hypothetical protein
MLKKINCIYRVFLSGAGPTAMRFRLHGTNKKADAGYSASNLRILCGRCFGSCLLEFDHCSGHVRNHTDFRILTPSTDLSRKFKQNVKRNARVHLVPLIKDLELGGVELAVIGADLLGFDSRHANCAAGIPPSKAIV